MRRPAQEPSGLGARRTTMRLPAHRPRCSLRVALVVTALLAAGCGSGDGDATADPSADPAPSQATSPSASPTPSAPPTPSGGVTAGSPGAEPSLPPARPRLVDLVSITAAGGEVTSRPTPVGSPAARRDYLADLGSRARAPLHRAVIAVDAPAGTEVTATVVAVGCDTPTDVEVTRTADGYLIEAAPMKPSGVQCFAPVTTIAVVVLPTA